MVPTATELVLSDVRGGTVQRAAWREGALVAIVTMIVLTVVMSALDRLGRWELAAMVLVSAAVGVVAARRDRPYPGT